MRWWRHGVALVLAGSLVLAWPAVSLAASGQIISPTSFKDIKQGAPDYWDVVQLAEAGIINVPADGLFQPNAPLTRLQFTVWMARALQLVPPASSTPFADEAQIPQADQPLVAAAVAAGLVKGIGNHQFAPDQPMTRIQVATILGRELVSHGQQPQARYFDAFEDGPQIPSWALPAAVIIQDKLMYGLTAVNGVLCSPEICFAPNVAMTRAPATALIVGFLNYLSQEYHGPALPKASPNGNFMMGFWDSGTSEAYTNLTAHGATINYLVDGGYDVMPGGILSGFDNSQNISWVSAHQGTQLWMMVQSMSPDQNQFLTSASQEQQIVAGIVAAIQRVGYAGVNLDVEGLPTWEGPEYTNFVSQVAAAVHALGAKVSVDVPAPFTTIPGVPSVGAYNYQALGTVADQVVVMAYSYHWPGTQPGPVAPLAWEQSVIAFGSSWVAPSKLVLGLPAYGYIWNDTTLAATAYWIDGMHNMAAANGAGVVAHLTSGEDAFTYQQGSTTYTGWFVGGRGLTDRINLAYKAGWAGVIGWRLDYGAASWWNAWSAAFGEYR